MPRSSDARSATLATPAFMVASARNLSKVPSGARRRDIQREPWQKAAWKFYQLIGEFRYSCDWLGNQLSKAKLTVLENGKPTKNQAALTALASLYGGPDGQVEMFDKLGTHLSVAGDALIFGVPNKVDASALDTWTIASPTNTTRSGTTWKIGSQSSVVYEDPLVIRIWEADPLEPELAAASSRAILLVLEELFGLTQRIQAQIVSRLASAGILVLPSEATFGSIPVAKKEGDDPDTEVLQQAATINDFIDQLVKIAMTSMEDRDDAAAMVPLVIQVAGEWVDKVQHIDWSSELDKQSISLRKEAIQRIALGMDLPPEALTGTGEMNHWSAWQMDEAGIKLHAEPKLLTIARGLTTGYLRPVMMSLDSTITAEALQTFTFGVDSTGLRVRPNRSKEAMELYDRGRLSAAALLRENGFDPETDAMPSEEFTTWLLTKMATGQTTPELVAIANRLLGVPVPALQEVAPPAEGRPTPSKAEHPVRELPAVPTTQQNDPLVAAASVLVQRALERAGNRIRTTMGGRKIVGATAATFYRHATVTAAEVDALLADAWEWVPPIAEQYHADAVLLTQQLHAYTRQLLLDGAEHTPAALAAYLAPAMAVA